jgi:aspartate racemase
VPDRQPILGIIGGAGVGAAARLYELVCARVRSQTGELPRVVLWNLPVSDALENSLMRGIADAEIDRMLAEAFDRLLAAGAGMIAMPCNTLQVAAAREAARCGVPFIDMIEATARAAGEHAVLIATAGTIAGGYYEGRGVELETPPPELAVGEFIDRALHGTPPDSREMRELVERARLPGATVIVGCTDICGLLDRADAAELDVVESLGVLADAVADALFVAA